MCTVAADSRFAKDDAVTSVGPLARNHRYLKAGGGEFVDQYLLRNAVPVAVFGCASYWRDDSERPAGWKVDDRKQAAGLERTEEGWGQFRQDG
jgi:hypothetical protein